MGPRTPGRSAVAIFADDIQLVRELVEKFGPAQRPVVECGGIPNPCLADYALTIQAMAALNQPGRPPAMRADVWEAQKCRYLNVERPLSFVDPDYAMEDPSRGGLPLERLHEKYNGDNAIGTAICLSVLEHVANPFEAIDQLWDAMKLGGLVIVSVPWEFPHHPSEGEDNWRFSPTGLRHLFKPEFWEVLACDWRLNISASAGVLNIQDGEPQAIRSAFISATAI